MGNSDLIGVNEKVVAAEKTLESRLRELRIDILNGVKNLATSYDENKTGLGAHSASIQALLTDLADFSNGEATGPVLKLTKRLQRDYTNRQHFIDNDPYGSGRRR